MQCLRHEINIQITLSNRSMSIKTIPWSTEFFHFSYIANKQWHSKTFSKTTLGLWEARISEHEYLFILFQMNLGGDSNNAKWDKVFKNGPSKICGRQPLKKLKGCLPQILLGPFLNTLSQIVCNYLLKLSSRLKTGVKLAFLKKMAKKYLKKLTYMIFKYINNQY